MCNLHEERYQLFMINQTIVHMGPFDCIVTFTTTTTAYIIPSLQLYLYSFMIADFTKHTYTYDPEMYDSHYYYLYVSFVMYRSSSIILYCIRAYIYKYIDVGRHSFIRLNQNELPPIWPIEIFAQCVSTLIVERKIKLPFALPQILAYRLLNLILSELLSNFGKEERKGSYYDSFLQMKSFFASFDWFLDITWVNEFKFFTWIWIFDFVSKFFTFINVKNKKIIQWKITNIRN